MKDRVKQAKTIQLNLDQLAVSPAITVQYIVCNACVMYVCMRQWLWVQARISRSNSFDFSDTQMILIVFNWTKSFTDR